MNAHLNIEQTEDLKAFEKRLTEIIGGLKPATFRWRVILFTATVSTAIGAYFWLTDPETSKADFLSSLWNNPFFALSCLFTLLLFVFGIHKRVVQSSIIASRCRTVIEDYNMSCNDTEHRPVPPPWSDRPDIASRLDRTEHPGVALIPFTYACDFIHQTSTGMKTFLYFAYGSNLLRQRLSINCPSAVLVATAFLQDHKLTWTNFYSDDWRGHPATFTAESGSALWGVVWRISDDESAALDRQEGVDTGEYQRMTITLTTSGQEKIDNCRTYHAKPGIDGLPSPQYKSVIVTGAKQSGLPDFYIGQLSAMADNGFSGTVERMAELEKMLQSK